MSKTKLTLVLWLGLAGISGIFVSCRSDAPTPSQTGSRTFAVHATPTESTSESKQLELWHKPQLVELNGFQASAQLTERGQLVLAVESPGDFFPSSALRGYVRLEDGTTVPLRRMLDEKYLCADLPGTTGPLALPVRVGVHSWVSDQPSSVQVSQLEFTEFGTPPPPDKFDHAMKTLQTSKAAVREAFVPVLESLCEFANFDGAQDVVARLNSALDRERANLDSATRIFLEDLATSLTRAAAQQQPEALCSLLETLRSSVP